MQLQRPLVAHNGTVYNSNVEKLENTNITQRGYFCFVSFEKTFLKINNGTEGETKLCPKIVGIHRFLFMEGCLFFSSFLKKILLLFYLLPELVEAASQAKNLLVVITKTSGMKFTRTKRNKMYLI